MKNSLLYILKTSRKPGAKTVNTYILATDVATTLTDIDINNLTINRSLIMPPIWNPIIMDAIAINFIPGPKISPPNIDRPIKCIMDVRSAISNPPNKYAIISNISAGSNLRYGTGGYINRRDNPDSDVSRANPPNIAIYDILMLSLFIPLQFIMRKI